MFLESEKRSVLCKDISHTIGYVVSSPAMKKWFCDFVSCADEDHIFYLDGEEDLVVKDIVNALSLPAAVQEWKWIFCSSHQSLARDCIGSNNKIIQATSCAIEAPFTGSLLANVMKEKDVYFSSRLTIGAQTYQQIDKKVAQLGRIGIQADQEAFDTFISKILV